MIKKIQRFIFVTVLFVAAMTAIQPAKAGFYCDLAKDICDHIRGTNDNSSQQQADAQERCDSLAREICNREPTTTTLESKIEEIEQLRARLPH